MKINLKSSIFKKIVLIILVIFVFNVVYPPRVEAKSFLAELGGSILETIFDFLIFLADAVIDILQDNFITQAPAITPATAESQSHFNMGAFGWLIAGICLVVIGVVAIASGGLAIPVIGGLLVPMVGAGLFTTVVAGTELAKGLRGDFDIPTIVYTPYTIFSGQIPAFDINYLNPMAKRIDTVVTGRPHEYSGFEALTHSLTEDEIYDYDLLRGYYDASAGDQSFRSWMYGYGGFGEVYRDEESGNDPLRLIESKIFCCEDSENLYGGGDETSQVTSGSAIFFDNIYRYIRKYGLKDPVDGTPVWITGGYVGYNYSNLNDDHDDADFVWSNFGGQYGVFGLLPPSYNFSDSDLSFLCYDSSGNVLKPPAEGSGLPADMNLSNVVGMIEVKKIITWIPCNEDDLRDYGRTGINPDTGSQLGDLGIQEDGAWVDNVSQFILIIYNAYWGIQDGDSLTPIVTDTGDTYTCFEDYYEHSVIGNLSVIACMDFSSTGEEVIVPPEDDYTYKTKEYESTARILQSAIATWYKALRRITIVVLLSMLIYVGIKIILSSVADQKAKYKRFFIDWLTALCLLFVLHYIMIFILSISTGLTKIFLISENTLLVEDLPIETKVNGEFLKDKLAAEDSCNYNNDVGEIQTDITLSDDGTPRWAGDFMGYIRLMCGYDTTMNPTRGYIYSLIYLVLVIDTCVFTVIYIKRSIIMAFLTMIAPLIAVTYPLDKIRDQQAQAFGMWIKEYTFNALIQPLHLVIYTMLISSAMGLAREHPIYALVALGFIIPAEKFLRKMFGFEKASTLSPMGAMAGGALLFSGMQKLAGLGKGKREKGESEKATRTKDKDGIRLPKEKPSVPKGPQSPQKPPTTQKPPEPQKPPPPPKKSPVPQQKAPAPEKSPEPQKPPVQSQGIEAQPCSWMDDLRSDNNSIGYFDEPQLKDQSQGIEAQPCSWMDDLRSDNNSIGYFDEPQLKEKSATDVPASPEHTSPKGVGSEELKDDETRAKLDAWASGVDNDDIPEEKMVSPQGVGAEDLKDDETRAKLDAWASGVDNDDIPEEKTVSPQGVDSEDLKDDETRAKLDAWASGVDNDDIPEENTVSPPGPYEGGNGEQQIEPSIPIPDDESKYKHSIKKGIKRIGNRYRKKFLKAKPMRKLGKFIAMGIGGATLGIVGLAAGISTGDPSKALAYTAGGFGVGAKVGGNLSDRAWDEAGRVKESFSKGYQGETEYTNKKLDKEFFQSDEYVDLLDNDTLFSNYSGRDRRQKIRETVQAYRSAGITDLDKTELALKIQQKRGLSTQETVWAMQLAQNFSRSEWNNPKIREAYKQQACDRLGSERR